MFPGGGYFSLLKNKWAISYAFFAVFLLSMGGRLYVVTSITAFLIFLSSYYRPGIKIKYFLLAGCVIIFGIGIIGVIRLGSTAPVTLAGVFYNILQEPLYESYTFVTYLKNYEVLNYISMPTVLTSSFINMVPSIIWMDKADYMTSIHEVVPKVKSPLGGMHFYVSFIADAGVIITMIGIMVLGICLGKLYRNKDRNSDTKNTVYCLVSANLMFTLLRDTVSVSLIKNILENAIFLPCLIMLINSILATMGKQRK